MKERKYNRNRGSIGVLYELRKRRLGAILTGTVGKEPSGLSLRDIAVGIGLCRMREKGCAGVQMQ